MTVSKSSGSRLPVSFLLVGLLVLLFPGRGEAQRLKADTVEASAVIQNGIATVTFKVEVTNDENSAFNNLWVVYSDQTSLSIGDVPAGASVVSKQENRVIDVSDRESRTIAMPVTLTFVLDDGTAVEIRWVLSVFAE